MKLFLVFSLLTMSVCACVPADMSPRLVFQKDGCRVYKFYDDRWIYYTTCNGKTSTSHSEGKFTVYDEVSTSVTK